MTDIVSVLCEMRGGQVVSDVNVKFQDMLKAVLDTGGKGELTIKLKVNPSKMALGGAILEVECSHECKAKKPELPVGKSIFFVSSEGTLSRSDPAQDAMFAPEPEPELKKERK